MAVKCVQGRGVMIDLHAHVGRERAVIGYDQLMRILEADKVTVEQGDMVCLHTGFAEMLLEMHKKPDAHALENSCAALDGRDRKLLKWITDSGLAALIADNYAVEAHPATSQPHDCASLPLHEHCLFKLGREPGRDLVSHRAGGLAAQERPLSLPAHRAAAAAARRGGLAGDARRDRVTPTLNRRGRRGRRGTRCRTGRAGLLGRR